jgi:hypothetical protein
MGALETGGGGVTAVVTARQLEEQWDDGAGDVITTVRRCM